jgi:hypothetical protein
MSHHGDWHEDALAAIWSRAKTERLVREGWLEPCGTDRYGRQLFRNADVMKHYALAASSAGVAGLHTRKAFGPGGAEYPAEYEPDIADGEYPDEYLEGDSPPDEDDEDEDDEDAEDADLDADLDEGGLDEPGDEDVGDRDDDLGGATMEDYIEGRIKALEADERLAAALADQADLWALGQSSLGWAVGRLRLWDSVRRWLGGSQCR